MDSSSMHRFTCRGLTKTIGLQYSCSSNITLKTESVPEMPSGPDEAPRTDAPCHSWPGKRKVELEWGLEKHSRTQWVFTSCVLVSNIVKRLGGVLPVQFLCFGSKKCWKRHIRFHPVKPIMWHHFAWSPGHQLWRCSRKCRLNDAGWKL